MKRLLLSLFIACLVLCAISAQAVVTLVPSPASPTPADLSDLDHYQAYQWAFNKPLPANIVSANIHFTSITNTQEVEANDILKVWLLDNKNTSQFLGKNWVSIGSNAYSQSWRWQDDQYKTKPFNDPSWPTQKYLIGSWTDPNSAAHTDPVDMPFDATALAKLNAWSTDSDWAIGFDPDCHYNNGGITLTFTTGPTIPEPMSLMLGIMGLGSVAGLRRLRKK